MEEDNHLVLRGLAEAVQYPAGLVPVTCISVLALRVEGGLKRIVRRTRYNESTRLLGIKQHDKPFCDQCGFVLSLDFDGVFCFDQNA